MIYLNKNESPIAPFSAQELAELFQEAQVHRYPRDQYQRFIELYSAQLGVDKAQMSLANGSDEWIQKLNILMPKGKMLMLDPDFTMYELYARQLGRDIVKVSAREDLTFDLDKILETIQREKPVFFIFAQPNNPLGNLYPQSFIEAACQAMKSVGGWCVVDEAYLSYADPEQRTRVRLEDHVLVLKTFSKLYGMAGLRIGLILSTPANIRWLDSIAHPYPINSLSLSIANAFLADEGRQERFFREHQRLTELLKNILNEELNGVCQVFPSQANYVLTRGEQAVRLGDYLTQQGFVLRRYDNPKLADCVRYSIGTREELETLRRSIREWKAEALPREEQESGKPSPAQNQGSESGQGNETGQGSEPSQSSAPGQDNGSASGLDQSSVPGQGNGTVPGQGSETGKGQGSSPDQSNGSEPGQSSNPVQGNGSVAGQGRESGQRNDNAPGKSNETDQGQGSESGQGNGNASGRGSETGPSNGSAFGQGSESGQGKEPDQDNETGQERDQDSERANLDEEAL